jgi:enolase
MSRIERVHARQILDSRGHPTVEVDVVLASGALGRADVPVGASTGRYEALEVRDGGEAWHGRGVAQAVANVHDTIGPHVAGLDAHEQEALDDILVALDGTSALVRLGVNAILGVSLAVARADAADAGEPLWRHLAGAEPTLPIPMLNVLEGGVHADNRLLIQEFMLVPIGAATFSDALRIGSETYHALGQLLLARGVSRAVGDEGGYAPAIDSSEAALELLVAAIESAGYRPGVDIALALDAAASELGDVDRDGYRIDGEAEPLTSDELVAYWADLCARYPIVSLEDALGEQDWSGWRGLTQRLGSRVQLVGDDLFVTHASLVQLAIDQGIANAVVIKPNQVGTLTRTLETIRLAHAAGYATVMAHRAGDTEDTTIADLAVAAGCRFIKAGGPARSERVGKYNRLLRIEEQLSPEPRFAARPGRTRPAPGTGPRR